MATVENRIGLYIIYHEIKNIIILSNFNTNGEACENLLTKYQSIGLLLSTCNAQHSLLRIEVKQRAYLNFKIIWVKCHII